MVLNYTLEGRLLIVDSGEFFWVTLLDEGGRCYNLLAGSGLSMVLVDEFHSGLGLEVPRLVTLASYWLKIVLGDLLLDSASLL